MFFCLFVCFFFFSSRLNISLFCAPITLFIFGICFAFYYLHTNGIIQYLPFSIWLISLSIIRHRSIHGVINDISFFVTYISFYRIYGKCETYMYIHSSIDGHFSCFSTFIIVNNVEMNLRVEVSFQISVFVYLFDKYPVAVLLDHIVVYF